MQLLVSLLFSDSDLGETVDDGSAQRESNCKVFVDWDTDGCNPGASHCLI